MHSDGCKLYHPGVGIQCSPPGPSQLWVAPVCGEVVRVLQLEMAVWQEASPLHSHYGALVIGLQVGDTEKKWTS